MATITRIEARIQTGNKADAGTNGFVYLGIGGREFHLDSANEAVDDFERNSDRTYVLGESLPTETTVSHAARNDPRVGFVLKSEFLDKFPVYIRLDPTDDEWNLERATVTAHTNAGVVAKYDNLGGFENNLWLARDFGLYCYLLKQ
jgi:hypothetical protein